MNVDEAGDDVHAFGVGDARGLRSGDVNGDFGDSAAVDGHVEFGGAAVLGVDDVAAFDEKRIGSLRREERDGGQKK